MTSQVVRQNFHLHITDCVNATLGLDNFKSDVHKMLGHTPNIYWRICWKVISPAFLAVRTVLGQQYIISTFFLFPNLHKSHKQCILSQHSQQHCYVFPKKPYTPAGS
jgi:hypothetical protein